MRGIARTLLLAASILALGLPVAAADPILFALEGVFQQKTDYTYTATLTPETSEEEVRVNLSLPVDRSSMGHSQTVTDLEPLWSPTPDIDHREFGAFDNAYAIATWSMGGEGDIIAGYSVHCVEETSYGPFITSSSYPLDVSNLPETARNALSTDFWAIQHWEPEIQAVATELSANARTQIEVIANTLGWVYENVSIDACYAPAEGADALWTLRNRIGNCVNFSFLTTALLIASGIPAVPSYGVVSDNAAPEVGHAWIAAYIGDFGWVEFESSNWTPSYGEVPATFLMSQHITMQVSDERGFSNTPFAEAHACSFEILERPREVLDVFGEVTPGEAISWPLTVRSPVFYESKMLPSGVYGPHKDYPVSLSLDGVPDGWHASISLDEILIREQREGGPADSRSFLLTVVPPDDAAAGDAAEIGVVARYADYASQPVVGTVTARVTVGD